MSTETKAMINVIINGDRREIPARTTLHALLDEMGGTVGDEPCAGAKVDNKVADLGKALTTDCNITFFPMHSRDGMLHYQRSLIYLLVMAVHEVYPDLRVYVNHTISDGFFCELLAPQYGIRESVPLSQRDLHKISEVMWRLVKENLPFERIQVSVDEAREIFERNGQMDKVRLLNYRKDPKISLYRCGTMLNHFCGYLIPRTGLLTAFELRLCDPGFLLRYPARKEPNRLSDFVFYPKLFRVYNEFEQWGKILGIETVADLNEVIDTGGINEFIKVAEALHEKKIAQIADEITQHTDRVRIVLISGPSSSGKTTFTKRLAIQLRVNGFRSVGISLDDFFVDRDKTPRDENGDYDFESFETIDADLFANCARRLMMGETVAMPKFDFRTGTSRLGEELTLARDQVLLVEGIHALNPRLLPSIPEGMKFRIFVSALTQLNIDYHNRIPSSDTRMIRRMVRDNQFRGYSAQDTINRWPSVRRGEARNIFPHQEQADVIFNTALTYELAVLRQYALPILQEITPDSPEYAEARRILYLLSYFQDIVLDEVPRHSLLREFIGGSSFNY